MMMRIPMPDAEVRYDDSFIRHDQNISYLDKLLEQVDWRQNKIKMFGKIYDEPRLTAWYGDEGMNYTYSGITLKPVPWEGLLSELLDQVNTASDTTFNSALLNYYRDGQDSMGWHQDNERELGPNPIIASLTLGAERVFQMRHIYDQTISRKDIPLRSGSLLIMGGTTQHHWKHQIPKTKKAIGPRLNITFRTIKPV